MKKMIPTKTNRKIDSVFEVSYRKPTKKIIELLKDIKRIISSARYNSIKVVNTEMLKAYFEIGRRIVEEEQKGKQRAGYGEKLLETISGELTKEFGRGFGITSIKNMRLFYNIYKYEIRQSLTDELRLTWTHYCELIKIKDKNKRKYFERYAQQENLNVRDLKRQIYSLHYERLLMSKNKKALIKKESRRLIPQKAKDIVKDPYILEFLGLEEKKEYHRNQRFLGHQKSSIFACSEKKLESKILNDLQKFLLELGQGFSFVSRQKRITKNNDHFYIDLLFYNIYLKCYVIIDLKVGKFKHEHIGQMNFYLNYVKNELNTKEDSEPVGIILCTEKDNVQVKYASAGLSNKLFVSKYKLYLPTKEELEKEIKKLL